MHHTLSGRFVDCPPRAWFVCGSEPSSDWHHAPAHVHTNAFISCSQQRSACPQYSQSHCQGPHSADCCAETIQRHSKYLLQVSWSWLQGIISAFCEERTVHCVSTRWITPPLHLCSLIGVRKFELQCSHWKFEGKLNLMSVSSNQECLQCPRFGRSDRVNRSSNAPSPSMCGKTFRCFGVCQCAY